MWILLALALLTLSFNKKIAVGLLLVTSVWAGWLGVIDLRVAGGIILLAAISLTGVHPSPASCDTADYRVFAADAGRCADAPSYARFSQSKDTGLGSKRGRKAPLHALF